MAFQNRRGVCAVVLVTIAVVASGGCRKKGKDSPHSAIAEEGSGPENTEPLFPLRVGLFGQGGGVFDGQEVLKAGRAFRLSNPADSRVDLYLDSAQGVLLGGGSLDGELSPPLLIVPAKVRQGMKWSVSAEGHASYDFEVTKRTANDPTRFGPRTTWVISRSSGTGDPVQQKYIEGIGVETTAFIPLDPEDDPAPPVAKVSLEPMTVPTDVVTRFRQLAAIDSLSMVHPANSAASLLIFNQGKVGECFELADRTVKNADEKNGAPYRTTTGTECPFTNNCNSDDNDITRCENYASAHGSGAFVLADGRTLWIPRGTKGEVTGASANNVGRDAKATVYSAVAILPSPNSEKPVALLDGQLGDDLVIGENSFDPDFGATENTVLNNWIVIGQRIPPTIIPLATDTGGQRTMVIVSADGLIWTSKLEKKQVTPPQVQFRLTGRLSVQAKLGGNEILRVSGDGVVDRLTMQGELLQLEHVADTAVPPKETAIGAFLVDGADGARLLIATTADDGIGAQGKPVLKMNLYRSTTPVTVGGGVEAPRRSAAYAEFAGDGLLVSGHDLLFCWPPTDQPVDTGSFRLHGKVPAMVVHSPENPSCALLVRAQDDQDEHAPDYVTIEGNVPGLGHFLHSAFRDPTRQITRGLGDQGKLGTAMLKGGGFVSERRLYGRGGILLGVPAGAIPSTKYQTGFPDFGGKGLWILNAPAPGGVDTDGFLLLRLGGEPASVRFTDGANPKGLGQNVMFPVQGGGLVVSYTAGTKTHLVRVAVDGTTTPLPDPSATREYCGMLADGTLCGFDSTPLPNGTHFCRDPSGTERTKATTMGPAGNALRCSQNSLPLPDGSLVAPNGGFRLDTATLEASPIDSSQVLTSWNVGSDGRIWGVAGEENPEPVEVLPTGFKSVAVPPAIPAQLANDGVTYHLRTVIPDEGVLLLEYRSISVGADGTSSPDGPMFRIPIPQ